MSIAATDYALRVARDVPHAAQPVLFALAARAGARTATTYTGGWLIDALNLTKNRVNVHVQTLDRIGVIAVSHRAGRASVIRFPLAGFIHSGIGSDAGRADAPASDPMPGDIGSDVAPPANPMPVSGELSGTRSAPGCPSCGHHVVTAAGVCPKCLYEPDDMDEDTG